MSNSLKVPRIATYCYWDLKTGTRLHHWGSGKWAVGNGPIEYIDEAAAMRLLEQSRKL